MKLLAIETATECCSVALWQDGQVLEHFEQAQRRQTALVLPMVEAVLAEAGIGRTALDAIAFSQGPGAFTGVRVSVSVAQGLAFSLDCPVIGVSTLAACAQGVVDTRADISGPLLVTFDARMGDIYLGLYEAIDRGLVEALLPDTISAPDKLPADYQSASVRWAAGSGVVYRDVLSSTWPGLQWYEDSYPRAGAVARLAVPMMQTGKGLPAEQALPVYLRDQIIQGAVR